MNELLTGPAGRFKDWLTSPRSILPGLTLVVGTTIGSIVALSMPIPILPAVVNLPTGLLIFGLGAGGGALAGYSVGRVIEDGLHLLKDKVLDGGRDLRNDFLNHRHFRPGGPR